MLLIDKIENYFTASQLTINKTDRENLSVDSLIYYFTPLIMAIYFISTIFICIYNS